MAFKPEYIISLGQDCSTLLFIKHCNIKHQQFIFDNIAVYSDTYLKLLDVNFLKNCLTHIEIYSKDSYVKILNTFTAMQKWNKLDPLRLCFSIFLNSKYDMSYIDVFHIDNTELFNLTYSNDLSKFLLNINNKAIPFVNEYIKKQIHESIKVLTEYCNKQILFVRTIKHVLTAKEINDLKKLIDIISKIFKKSNIIFITDIEENLKSNIKNIKYLKFNHWTYNIEDNNNFKKIIENI